MVVVAALSRLLPARCHNHLARHAAGAHLTEEL
jgi:hypothetical protein